MRKIYLLLFVLLYSCGTTKEVSKPIDIVPVQGAPYVEYSNSISVEEVTAPVKEKQLSVQTSPKPMADMEETPIGAMATRPVENDNKARLVYEIPHEMVKHTTYTIEARIADDTNNEEVNRGIIATSDTIIRSSPVMQVELIDPSGLDFTIVSQSAQQIVEEDGYTTWVFYVTPIRHGEGQLSLVVSIIKDGNLKQTVYKDTIKVNTSTWIEIRDFLGKYWQWAIGFLTITLIPFIRNMLKKSK